MVFFPPIPDWDGIHPIVIHFPIALLLVAPLFVVLGLIFYPQRRVFFISGLILMGLGTIGAYFAVASGEAAAQLVPQTPAISKVIREHHELGETTRLIFTILTLIFAVLAIGPRFLKKEIRRVPLTLLHAVFLVLYLSGSIVLADTGHLGGLLVHEYGVQAMVNTADDPGAALRTKSGAPSAESQSTGHEDNQQRRNP